MIYLIGGAPRTGKSLLASKLIAQQVMPLLSLDFLYNLEQVRQVPGFERADILEKGRLFYPTLKDLLVDVRRRTKDCVIEGEVILPEFLSELSAQYAIRCCFIGLSSTTLDTILEHGGYFNWPSWKLQNGLEHEVGDLAEQTIKKSAIIEEEAKKFAVPYFDLAGDYERLSQAALQALLA